jgi:membrane associated rhomboid family serine protease
MLRPMRPLIAAWPVLVLTLGLGLLQSATLGWRPTEADLIAEAAGLAAPARAFGLHASVAHGLSNGVLLLLFAALWTRLAAFSRPQPRVELGPLALTLVCGPTALALAAAIDGAPRVGASGAVYALLGALPVLAFAVRRDLPAPLRTRAPAALAVLALALLGLGAIGPAKVDALSHALGFGLGAVASLAVLRPRVAMATGASAAVFWTAALLSG